ncbi:hypothetical protein YASMINEVIRUS_928 [Yasminevirus sp. GU-2018]|uniref:Uncharacterized protein n=1 Tax=Yasminevirus sp. GU-2018 TaxID=2420051 RepID=A0A5K0U9L2_9VIRU|nr:hypothetical protein YASMINEVIRUS_928 [Yasminevirus sp. GU-2018]
MSSSNYYFIENRDPSNDPNVDLDFGNDILYKELTGDELDKYKTYQVVANVKPAKTRKRVQLRANKDKNDSGNSIYILFIVLVVGLVLFWYFYGSRSSEKQQNILDTYPDQPELTMLSPDVGMELRLGKM